MRQAIFKSIYRCCTEKEELKSSWDSSEVAVYHKVVNAALWLRMAMVTYLEMFCFQSVGEKGEIEVQQLSLILWDVIVVLKVYMLETI